MKVYFVEGRQLRICSGMIVGIPLPDLRGVAPPALSQWHRVILDIGEDRFLRDADFLRVIAVPPAATAPRCVDYGEHLEDVVYNIEDDGTIALKPNNEDKSVRRASAKYIMDHPEVSFVKDDDYKRAARLIPEKREDGVYVKGEKVIDAEGRVLRRRKLLTLLCPQWIQDEAGSNPQEDPYTE